MVTGRLFVPTVTEQKRDAAFGRQAGTRNQSET
jgi:hypothetical protein